MYVGNAIVPVIGAQIVIQYVNVNYYYVLLTWYH